MTSNGGTARPKLPALVVEKLSKTGYTRGATVREIYQNRVTRYNPVLIPWDQWELCKMPNDGSDGYENGFIVIIEPQWYFMTPEADEILAAEGVELGVNALLYYNRRFDWLAYRPTSGTLDNGKPFQPATSRSNPLGGTYFARIHATTAADGVVEGFNSSALRGAGIRVYEYASSQTISDTKIQLEALFLGV
ncbi:hypothetical protein AHiyo1_09350 [Arthrobacter sp. Hiyo1]|uniref:BstXI family restriction endonuclease n=1 Tax=Arthrobacter sp. Hiyo1 TaxID=1588020 RepID=UPI0007238409|nr:BstXI family restriction endonuclease [Arthrobacter sp. Hiyo1]GAP57973.1 hypothetical protein AHiyo1_09350 [Arthrobacter sp. Hiyo1]